MSRPGRPGTTAAVFVGGVFSFVVAVNLVRLIRPALLLDPEPAWAVARLLLWVGILSATTSAGVLAAAGFLLWNRSWLGRVGPGPLSLSRSTLVVVAVAAIGIGVFFRAVGFGRVPIHFIEDDINLISPALALTGSWRDFADSIRPIPHGSPDPHEVIGVLYLRLLRGVLHVFGTTIVGVRFLSFLGGALSLLTGTLLGRALLPRGGGAIVALVLAGMRWHLILSRWGWHSILLVVLLDAATLLLLVARRQGRAAPAIAAGLLVGVGAHFYLVAWVPAVALLTFCLWPPSGSERRVARLHRFAGCAAGLLLAAAPLFLLHEGRTRPYFGRAGHHSVVAEMRYTRSLLPLFSVAADAFVAPWFLPEPAGWMDLPGRSRLGLVLGIPVAIAFGRALAAPREELSALLLLQAAAGCAAAVAAGQAGHPHGFRYGYLTSLTAVAAAAGILQLVRLPPSSLRRAGEISAIGLLAVSGAAGARDALLRWPDHRATFDGFSGQDTLIGRTAARWETYGLVRVAPHLGRSDTTIDTVRRYRLALELPRSAVRSGPGAEGRAQRLFRIVPADVVAEADERLVEHVRDGWGREWAIVLARAIRGS
ncbi:MAG TPA: glycosyltransferase family 39 protein [Thermoanaerobaculia bacterium]